VAIAWDNSGWEAGAAYPVGARIINPPSAGAAPNVYEATAGGTSDPYGTGPTGTDPDSPITDGSVVWKYLGEFTGSVVDVAAELAGFAGARVMLKLAEKLCADASLWGDILDDGRRYLAAHLAQLSLLEGRGPVSSESVGPISSSYASLVADDALMLTPAGRTYRTLARTTPALFGSVP
jgi:hypothetical protein